MDVLGLLWYVFLFLFFFLFLFLFLFGWGNWDEREGVGERGMDRWREGGRRKREGGWVEERVLWIGSDWTELVNELYCSLSGSLAERDGEEETGLSFFFPPFFLFSFFSHMKREERFTCVDLFCAFFLSSSSPSPPQSPSSHKHRRDWGNICRKSANRMRF